MVSSFKHERDELKQLQALDLKIKILMTRQRIRDWVNEYGEENCYVLTNGTAESFTIQEIVKKYYPKVRSFNEKHEDLKVITSWMAANDEAGIVKWLLYGCNHYDTERPECRPLAFWMNDDVERYVKEYLWK